MMQPEVYAPLLFADYRTAARLFDMSPAEFREAVDAGFLPRPCMIGGHERWDVEELKDFVAAGARWEALSREVVAE